MPKGNFHCLSEASLKIPGSFEERKEVRRTSSVIHTANATGVFFLVRFLDEQKNEQINQVDRSRDWPSLLSLTWPEGPGFKELNQQ